MIPMGILGMVPFEQAAAGMLGLVGSMFLTVVGSGVMGSAY